MHVEHCNLFEFLGWNPKSNLVQKLEIRSQKDNAKHAVGCLTCLIKFTVPSQFLAIATLPKYKF